MPEESDAARIVAAGSDAAADRYADLEQEGATWPRMRWLRDLLARLPEGAAVLDLGCATGVPAAAAIAQRHRVTGVDVSSAQVARARRNVSTGKFICADAAEVDLAERSFDPVVSFYTFDHIPRERHADLLERIHRWLRPGGYLLLSVEDTDQPGAISDWLGVKMHFSMFEAEATRALVREAGFTMLETAVEVQTEQDADIPYVWILARATT